jgi:cellulose synthase (UDP-forming)
VPDVIRIFGAYFVWVLAALNFMTGNVVLPILTDVSQLIGSVPISRAAFTGLAKPNGHPFKVTAKGGDRERVVVQWRLMLPFAVLLALTVLGLAIGILSDRFAFYDAGDGKAVVLFWTLYNVIVLSLTVLLCVELPRKERHVADAPERALFAVDGVKPQRLWIVSLTESNVRVRGKSYAPGTEGIIRISGVGDIPALVTQTTADGAQLSLSPNKEIRQALLKKFYADGEAPGIVTVRLGALFEDVARRLSFSRG